MTSPVDRVARFVDEILHDRRPSRFPAEPEEAPAMLAASALKAARPGADLPDREFIANLERGLAAEVARGQDEVTGRRFSRRTLLQLSGLSAAAAVVGGMVGRLSGGHESPETAQGPARMGLKNGTWVAVASTTAVGPGQAVRFSSGAVEGFLINRNGQVQALSAVCTHMGCLLKFNAQGQRLDCPCHGASFNLDGSPLNHTYLTSLPHLNSRVNGTTIEVEVPRQA